MNVLIDGFGVHDSGIAAALYFHYRNDSVTIAGQSVMEKSNVKVSMLGALGISTILHPLTQEDVDRADIVVKVNGGTASSAIENSGKPVISEFGWFFSSAPADNVKNIIVTGSRGKSAAAAMIAHILNSCGHPTTSCGNMGLSPFTLLSDFEKRLENGEPLPEYNICEISTWQLSGSLPAEYRDGKKKLEALVVTDLFTEDFPDGEMPALAGADKCFRSILTDEANAGAVCRLLGCRESKVKTAERKVADGGQNLLPRAMAAVLGLRQRQIKSTLITYKGIPHRCEFIGKNGNILFINDSAANVPEAVNFSLINLRPLKVHLICGGTDDQFLCADRMLPALKEAASVHLLDGSFTRHKLIPLLESENIKFTPPLLTVEEAVGEAYDEAEKTKRNGKDDMHAVLLSPGAKTYELFEDEFERGAAFRDYVVGRFQLSSDAPV